MKTICTITLTLICVLISLSGNTAIQWSNVGPAGFSGDNMYKPKMTMGPGSEPYVAYNDHAAGNRLTVKKYSGGNWMTVGIAGFSDAGFDDVVIAINEAGAPYVAYSDYSASGFLTVKMFDGTAWVTVGTKGFSADAVDDKAIAFDSSGKPYVVFKEVPWGAESIHIKRFDGTSWQDVGLAGFSCNNTSTASVVIDSTGHPIVAYTARGSGFSTQQVTVKTFDGMSWNPVGGAISFAGGYSATLAINSQGVLYVSYTDGLPYWANVKMFDGTSWVSVGNANFSAGQAFHMTMKLDNNDVPYVAYDDWGNDFGITVKKLSGATWATVGVDNMSDISSAFASLAFDAANIPYVAFQWGDEAGKPLVVRRFTTVPDFEAGAVATGPHCPGSSMDIPFHITNGVFYPDNIFTAHLSNSNGSFANYSYIGTLAGVTDGTITATLPAGADGSGYRVRIISSNPYAVSEASIAAITIQGTHNVLKTYTGSDGDWSDPLKWTPCGVPNENDDVEIDGAITVTIPQYFTANSKNIMLSNGASFLMEEGSQLDSRGTIQINSGSAMTAGNSSYIGIRPTAKLLVNGTLTNNGAIVNGGLIGGNGTIIQNGYLGNQYGAFISPGNSAGTLTIVGDLNLGESTLLIEVNGTTAGSLYDVLNVTGTVTLTDATLQVVAGNGYTFPTPYLISFINAGSLNSTFLNELPSGTTVSYNAPAIGQTSLIGLSPLPLKLTNFTVTQGETANTLHWETAAEESSDLFNVERSADGQSFNPIGTLNAVGKASTYHFSDNNPMQGKSYYRLKIIAGNNDVSHSKTLMVNMGGERLINAMTTIPNPAKESFLVTKIPASLLGSMAIVYDAQGSEKYRFQMSTDKVIQIGNWLPGTYLMKVANGQVLRLIKQ